MATITSTGVGSGLDVNNIVSSLMALEQRPLTLLQKAASTMQTKISAFGTLKGQIASLGDVASKLADAKNWNPLRADSSDAAAASATVANTAVAGKYSLVVDQLAQSQVLASGTYASSSAVVGTGQLKIELGTTAAGVFTPKSGATAVTIDIPAGKQTLAGVRDAINAAGAGVSASIVSSGGTARLVLRGTDGAEQSVRVTATDADGVNTDAAGLSALAFDPAAAAGSGKNMTQSQAAQDAKFSLNGIALTSATNTPANVVDGVTFTLKKVSATPVDITVSVETMAVKKNINDFVNAYNALNTLVKQQTLADPEGDKDGPLQADSTATSLLPNLREMLRGSVTGLDSPSSLNAAGLELQRDGSLTVNETKLAPFLEAPSKLARLFGQAQSGADTASRGFGVRFKAWAAEFTSDTGRIAARTDGLKRSVDRNSKDQDALEAKITRTEARLRAQYQRLDTQMTSLSGQLAQMKSALGIE